MSNMEIDYPVQEFELNDNDNKVMSEVIAKNFNTILNIIQSHELYDVNQLKHLHELCNVLHIMINEYNNNINLYSENNKTVNNFRDAGLDLNNISSRRNKLFPTLTPWQVRDILEQLESVLMFVTELKFELMNDFRINNLFSIHKIDNLGDLINGVHNYLNNYFNFGYNISADFTIIVDDGLEIENVIKRFKRKKYLDDNSRSKLKLLLSKYLVYEIKFNFKNLGININPLKNF
uniref:P27 protein n=1 Tax=croton golden spot associated virus C TaxID=3072822 RepID=A0AA50E4V3_9CLOS|nr:p27 protein [croton golden spot associated virus C]